MLIIHGLNIYALYYITYELHTMIFFGQFMAQCNVSARELEVKTNIPTFDTLRRKLIYRFIERCCLSRKAVDFG